MNDFIITYDRLLLLDRHLKIPEADKYDTEIEYIVANLWQGIGDHEILFQPFFSTYLQSGLLRQFYIYYLSLRSLKKKHKRITINASTDMLDLIGKHFDLELHSHRSKHDREFLQVREYFFSKEDRLAASLFRRWLRSCRNQWRTFVASLTGVDVLYFDAGKLQEDFAKIPKAFSATLIDVRKSRRMPCDVEVVIEKMGRNILEMDLSIPNELLLEFIRLRVFKYLPDVLDRIGTLAEFIEKHHVRLVIISAVTHEDHLCLLAAAKLTGTESLAIPHGFTMAQNTFLHRYVTHQGTLNKFERQYAGATQFPLRMSWFERKI